jgi:hypothetical protein
VGTATISASPIDRFSDIVDRRVERTRRRDRFDIVAVTLCAAICGADTWVDVAVLGRPQPAEEGSHREGRHQDRDARSASAAAT